MSTNLPDFIVEQLKEPFQKVLSTENFGEPVNDIAELIGLGQLTAQNFDKVLHDHKDVKKINDKILDMVLAYINLILIDNFITPKEAESIKYLKRFFKIKEGDFYSVKYNDIERILNKQFEHMYHNNIIDTEEALQKVELQELFDLSYDQFLQLSQNAVKAAIDRGANPIDLDTFIKSS
jgi:hypothetical protein